MKKYMVSLVSVQAVPNILFIGELINSGFSADTYIFITTQKMENMNKIDNIVESAHIDKTRLESVIVVEDSLINIEKELNSIKFRFEDYDEILVNITCGTKIMSIGVYNFFKELKGTKIFYLPFGKNVYNQVFPVSENEHSLHFRITLEDYLKSYGISIISRTNAVFRDERFTEEIFNAYIGGKFPWDVLEKLRHERNKKHVNIDDKLRGFLKDINFCPCDDTRLNKEEICYLTGGWFEEYTYNLIRKKIVIDDAKIAFNVKISRNRTENEFDVMFVYENSLYVIECKTALKDGKKKLFNKTIYKLAALKRDFGLDVTGVLFTLDSYLSNKEGKLESCYLDRASLFNIRLADRPILSNSKDFDRFFNSLIGKK